MSKPSSVMLKKRLKKIQNPKEELLVTYLGCLKDSPNLNEDPVKLQRKMRSEWR